MATKFSGRSPGPTTAFFAAVIASPATLLDPGRLLCRSPPRAQLELAKRGRGAIRVAVALNAQNFVHKKTPIFVFYAGVTVAALGPPTGPPTDPPTDHRPVLCRVLHRGGDPSFPGRPPGQGVRT